MRKLLLTSAALSALLLTAPVYAQDQGHHRGDSTRDSATPAAAPAATPTATDDPTPLGGMHGRNGHGHDNQPASTPTPPQGAPATIPGTPLLAPGAGGQAHGDRHDNNSGHDNNAGGDNSRGDSNAGRNTGGSNPFGGGGHAGHQHNNAFDVLRRVLNAPHHYRHGAYHRPNGWYTHRWNYGEFLPALFFARDYWISDYEDFDLPVPPPGTVWVRYGNDALLVDRYTGEVIEVEYGLFY